MVLALLLGILLTVIHHVSQPYQVLKCPEFVSTIRRLNHFFRLRPTKKSYRKEGKEEERL